MPRTSNAISTHRVVSKATHHLVETHMRVSPKATTLRLGQRPFAENIEHSEERSTVVVGPAIKLALTSSSSSEVGERLQVSDTAVSIQNGTKKDGYTPSPSTTSTLQVATPVNPFVPPTGAIAPSRLPSDDPMPPIEVISRRRNLSVIKKRSDMSTPCSPSLQTARKWSSPPITLYGTEGGQLASAAAYIQERLMRRSSAFDEFPRHSPKVRPEQAVDIDRRSSEHLETESSVSIVPAMPALAKTWRHSRESLASDLEVIQSVVICFAALQEAQAADKAAGALQQSNGAVSRLRELNMVNSDDIKLRSRSPTPLVTPVSPTLSSACYPQGLSLRLPDLGSSDILLRSSNNGGLERRLHDVVSGGGMASPTVEVVSIGLEALRAKSPSTEYLKSVRCSPERLEASEVSEGAKPALQVPINKQSIGSAKRQPASLVVSKSETSARLHSPIPSTALTPSALVPAIPSQADSVSELGLVLVRLVLKPPDDRDFKRYPCDAVTSIHISSEVRHSLEPEVALIPHIVEPVGWATTFVLGCGLGVMLRMMMVLCVITFRAIKERRAEETEYTIIHEYVVNDKTSTSASPYAHIEVPLGIKELPWREAQHKLPVIAVSARRRNDCVVSANITLSASERLPSSEAAWVLSTPASARWLQLSNLHRPSLELVVRVLKPPNRVACQRLLFGAVNILSKRKALATHLSWPTTLWIASTPAPSLPFLISAAFTVCCKSGSLSVVRLSFARCCLRIA